MKKTILLLLLMIALVLTGCQKENTKQNLQEGNNTSEKSEYKIEEEPFTYMIKDNKASIIEYDEELGGTDVVIPNTTKDGIPVTEIGESVFSRKDITSADFSNTTNLEVIGKEAFLHNKMVSLNIPKCVKVIKQNAFAGITDITTKNFAGGLLENLVLNEGLERIEGGAFSQQPLTSVNIPSTVKYLSGFSYTNLERIDIPEGVEILGTGGLSRTNLTPENIIFPKSIKTIESYALPRGIEAVPEGVEKMGLQDSIGESFVIPSTVKELLPSPSYAAVESTPQNLTIVNKTKRALNWEALFANNVSDFETTTTAKIDAGVTGKIIVNYKHKDYVHPEYNRDLTFEYTIVEE